MSNAGDTCHIAPEIPAEISLPDGRRTVYDPLLGGWRRLRPRRVRNVAINASILWAVGFGYVMLGDVLDSSAALGAGLMVISGIAIVV